MYLWICTCLWINVIYIYVYTHIHVYICHYFLLFWIVMMDSKYNFLFTVECFIGCLWTLSMLTLNHFSLFLYSTLFLWFILTFFFLSFLHSVLSDMACCIYVNILILSWLLIFSNVGCNFGHLHIFENKFYLYLPIFNYILCDFAFNDALLICDVIILEIRGFIYILLSHVLSFSMLMAYFTVKVFFFI